MITTAYVMKGMGDALNTRDFLLNYCEQRRVNPSDITIYTLMHEGIFEGDGFRFGRIEGVDLSKLTYFGNFCTLDLKKSFVSKKYDETIAINASIDYSFENEKPLNWEIPDMFGLPDKFVTINYGHDNRTNPNKICTKMWKIEYWEELVKKIGVPCVQIGGGWSCKEIKGVAKSFVNKLSLKQSVGVMKKALFHIDIEGGLVILGHHFGVKSAVLFGSTDPRQYARKGNLTIRNTNCPPCSGSVETKSKNLPVYISRERLFCRAKCMNDLKPDYVIGQIYKSKWLI